MLVITNIIRRYDRGIIYFYLSENGQLRRKNPKPKRGMGLGKGAAPRQCSR